MRLQFHDDPFSVAPTEDMCQVDRVDGGWQIRYYDRLVPGAEIRLALGINRGYVARADEIVDLIQQYNESIKTLVIAEQAFRQKFQKLFDMPTVSYQTPEGFIGASGVEVSFPQTASETGDSSTN